MNLNDKAEDLAHDRWPEILVSAGIDSSFFGKHNGPCPFCGGKDRYRWSSKFGGAWVCNQCTDGRYANGFKMLMEHMGYQSFRQAADHVRDYFGSNQSLGVIHRPVPALPIRSAQMSEQEMARNRQRILKFWSESKPIVDGDPVYQYMQRRCPGMTIDCQDLRHHPALQYWAPPDAPEGSPKLLGTFPAMLALAHNALGEVVQLHKTFLTEDGHKAPVPLPKKTDYGVGANAFAIRLMPVEGDTLGVSEGIESAWGAAMLKGIPVWPCLNGSSMARFTLPEELKGQVKRLIIFADHDELKKGKSVNGVQKYRRPGSEYAAELADHARVQGLRAMIIKPATPGHDMANQWQLKRETSIA